MNTEFLNSLYQTILKGEDYYEFLINDFTNCRSHNRNQVVFQYKDRGNKCNLVWDYFISPLQADNFKNRHSSEVSFFKEWLFLKLNHDIILQLADLKNYFELLNTDKAVRVSQHNYYECYGICMILFDLLNKTYMSNQKFIPYNLLRLAFFYSMTFSEYHLDRDILKSVDVLSNFARMHDYFGKDTIALLLDAGIANPVGVKFIYIWAMQKCYEILPPVHIKLHYHTNARMMHQNQTVGGVTEDKMETSFMDCYRLGHFYADKILQSYESKLEVNGFVIDPEMLSQEFTSSINHIIKSILSNPTIRWMQFLNISIQIEKFDGIHIIKPPYIPSPIHYTYLLRNMGLDDEKISSLEVRKESNNKYNIRVSDIFGMNIEYSDETRYRIKDRYVDTDPSFRDMILMVDQNKDLHSIVITGNHLYPLKKDIDRTSLFYGIPCRVLLHEFRHVFYDDRIILAVFGVSESVDSTLFNS